MADFFLITYVFSAFLIGAVCFGGALVLSRRREDRLARAFLFFYLPFSLLVLTGLAVTFTDTVTGLSGGVVAVADYLESFPGRYAIMLALPLFAHRVYAVRAPRRESLLVGLVVVAFAAQHGTEFVLGGAWDRLGDVAEDLLFALIIAYTLAVAVRHRRGSGVYRPLARRFLLLLLLGIPGAAHDLFLTDGPGFRLYPLWYSVLGLVIVVTLVRRSFAVGGTLPVEWDLTPREEEIVGLLCRGLTNRQIAEALTISENTVKTHVRAIYDKSAHRSRLSLVAALTSGPSAVGVSARSTGD